jgi:O-antigen/teichoic acid export membrane protein
LTPPSLATRAVRGFLWNGSASFVQLGTIVVLYALLDIEKLGSFEWGLSLVMLLAIVGDLGLGAALVQLRETDEAHFDTAFWTNAAWGIWLTVLVSVGAPALAGALGGEEPELFVRVVRILSWLVPFASVSAVFRARLQRELNFSAVAISEVVSSFSFALAVMMLLWTHPEWGVFVPVVASVFREVGLLCSLWYSTRWLPGRRWQSEALRQLLRFALNFTGSRAVAYFNTKIAHFFIFPLLGGAALGYYAIAERLTLTPLTRLATTINRVSFPAFSTIQDDDGLLRKGYVQSVQSLLLCMGPLLAGVFVFADQVLQLLDKEPALLALRLLALATLFKVVGTMVGSIFMAKGRTDWSFYWSLFSVAVLVPSMYFVGVPRGLEGVTGVIAASSCVFLMLSQQLANRLIGLSFLQYIGHLMRPSAVVLGVFVVLWLARPMLEGTPLFILIQGAVLGGCTLLLLLRLLVWDLCASYWRRLRG